MKKILILSLVAVLMFSSLVMAKTEEPIGFKADFGKVTEIVEDEKYPQILLESQTENEEVLDKVYLYTSDLPVMDLKTGEFVEDYKFEKDELVKYFYKENTPVLQSLPAKMTPDFIAVNVEEGTYSIDVDYFDEEGLGKNNRLKLNLSDELEAVNLAGEKVEEFLEKDLAVLYTVATRSLPPIATPNKIIVLDNQEKVVDLMDYKAEDEMGFFLRKYYEALGAEVKWDGENDITTISLNEKSITIENAQATLKIEDQETVMEAFSIVDGVSYIQEEHINLINDFLMN
ncbi:MAG: stalk domain-containing protein [Bacillota bacterium]|nr:stalk domain-containing protein [Bacillota bacterium]